MWVISHCRSATRPLPHEGQHTRQHGGQAQSPGKKPRRPIEHQHNSLEQLTFFNMDRSCSSLMQLSSSALTSACRTQEPDVAGTYAAHIYVSDTEALS